MPEYVWSDNEADAREAFARYREFLSSVWDTLPVGLRVVCGFEAHQVQPIASEVIPASVFLHDAEVVSVSALESGRVCELILQADDEGASREIVLRYDGVRECVNPGSAVVGQVVEFHEVARLDDGAWVHMLLLKTEEELRLIFEDCHIRVGELSAEDARLREAKKLYHEGCDAMDAGRADEALALFEKSAGLDRTGAVLHRTGIMLHRLGRDPEAAEVLAEAMTLNGSAQPAGSLAKVLMAMGETDRAREAAQEALRRHADFGPAKAVLNQLHELENQ